MAGRKTLTESTYSMHLSFRRSCIISPLNEKITENSNNNSDSRPRLDRHERKSHEYQWTVLSTDSRLIDADEADYPRARHTAEVVRGAAH